MIECWGGEEGKWYFHFTHSANNLSIFLFGFVVGIHSEVMIQTTRLLS